MSIQLISLLSDFVLNGVTLSTYKDKQCDIYSVSFEIIQSAKSCKTLSNEVKSNTLSTWSDMKLGNCYETTFDGNLDNILFKMQTNVKDDYCSKEIVMEFNHYVVLGIDFKRGKNRKNIEH